MTETYELGYLAHTTTGKLVTLPDHVAENQIGYDGQEIVVNQSGKKRKAILRGDLYGLDTPGTGDPIVELI